MQVAHLDGVGKGVWHIDILDQSCILQSGWGKRLALLHIDFMK